MRTGRKRVAPASSAASTGVLPSVELSARAKLSITRMLFAVATPMHMIAPVKRGDRQARMREKSNQTMPASAAGRAVMITKGSSQD